MSFWVLRH
jgi:hypothetical protein